MEATFLSEKAKEIITEIRNADGYSYGWMNRKAAICDAICKMSVFPFDGVEEKETLAAVVLTLSEYNELLTALSEVRGNE